jgi:hypothetical protein
MKRRTISYIFSLLICSGVIAQTSFEKQLSLIIKDSTNRFKSFKAGFKYQIGNDSVFYSAFNLEGTSDNDVVISNEQSAYIMDSYMAEIAKSTTEKQGAEIVDEWKSKISAIVGNSFQLTKLNNMKYPLNYGWHFEHGYFMIDIVYIPRKGKTKSSILFHISYLHLHNLSN